MPVETLEDVLPPPPHKVLKEAAEDVKGMADNLRKDAAGVADEVRSAVVALAPHNVVKDLPKPSIGDLAPPPPPKPPKPPRLSD